MFTLLNGNGSIAGGSINVGSGHQRITYTATASGTNYLAVSGGTAGSYSLTSAPADDYTNTTATTGTLAIGGMASGALQTVADTDDFAVTLQAGFAYQFDVQGQDGLTSLGFELYDSTGAGRAGPHDQGAGHERITYTANTSGTYYLAVSGSTPEAYSVTSAPVDDYTNTTATTGTLAIGGMASGALQTVADTDDFAVTLQAGFAYQFDVQGQDGLTSLGFELYDSTGAGRAGPHDQGAGHERITYTANTSGTYYLAVSGSTPEAYSVTSAPADDYTDDTGTTGTLLIGGTASGALQTVADTDDFRVTLQAGFAYQFDVQGQGGLTGLAFTLLNGNGSISGGSINVGTGHQRITYTATASGTYYLAVSGGIAGSYQMTATSNNTLAYKDDLFDSKYYLANNPDVAAAGVDPYQHYMTIGWKEGRNPSALFNTNYYENQNLDVKAAGINPLTHFETSGWKEGRDPSITFSDSKYLAANPDVAAAGIDPLLHYTDFGQFEGRAIYAATPHATAPQDPLVDAAYVYGNNPAVAAAGLDATAWYDSTGWKLGANPDPYFDTNYYLTQNPDVKSAGVNPLQHFESSGWKEGRDPSLVFSDSKYLSAYPDVVAAGVDPLLHYEVSGQHEGRMTFLSGRVETADPLINAAYYDAQLGATLIPTGVTAQQQAAASYNSTGWLKDLNPDYLFDTSYYLSHNPDVAAAHIDPLTHYEQSGWHEGRNPSAQFSTDKYLAANPDVKAAGVDPLLHYIASGQAEERAIYPV